MIITQKINMDLRKPTVIPGINAVQGDTYTRQLEISLFDSGEAWQIPGGTTVLVRYIRGDGTGGEYDTRPSGEQASAISGNVISLVLAPQMLTEAGVVQVNVTLIREEQRLSTFRFLVNVHPNAGAELESSEGYYHVSGFLPMPETAEAEQLIRVREVDERGIARRVEAISAEDLDIWIPTQIHYDLTSMSADVARRAMVLGTTTQMQGGDAYRIRYLAVKAAPGTAVRFALYEHRAEDGILIRGEIIGDAVADNETGLAVWAREEGHWVRGENMVVMAVAESASIYAHVVGEGIVVVGQLKFDDGDYYGGEPGDRIPCRVADEETASPNDIWDAPHMVQMDILHRRTVGEYLLDTGVELSDLDQRIRGLLPSITVLDEGKVMTVSGGKYVLAKPAASAQSGVQTTAVLQTRTISGFEDADGMYIVQLEDAPFALVAGQVYRVIWDGAEYICAAAGEGEHGGEGVVILGNGAVVMMDDTGEPFCMVQLGGIVLIAALDPTDHAVSHSIGIYRDELGLMGDYIRFHVDRYIDEALGGEY